MPKHRTLGHVAGECVARRGRCHAAGGVAAAHGAGRHGAQPAHGCGRCALLGGAHRAAPVQPGSRLAGVQVTAPARQWRRADPCAAADPAPDGGGGGPTIWRAVRQAHIHAHQSGTPFACVLESGWDYPSMHLPVTTPCGHVSLLPSLIRFLWGRCVRTWSGCVSQVASALRLACPRSRWPQTQQCISWCCLTTLRWVCGIIAVLPREAGAGGGNVQRGGDHHSGALRRRGACDGDPDDRGHQGPCRSRGCTVSSGCGKSTS